MKKVFAWLSAILVTASVQAASITVNNPGFEAAGLAAGGWSDAAPTGWSDPQGGDNTNFVEFIPGFASEGTHHIGFDGNNEFGMIYQDLGVPWLANTDYTLTIGVGNRSGSFAAGLGRFSLTSTDEVVPLSTGSSYMIWTPTTGFSQDVDTGTIATTPGTFSDVEIIFSTGAVAPSGNVRLGIQSINTTGLRLHIDNVRLDAETFVVPEPTSLSLMGLAIAGLARRRRA